jgi:hypothetical protein
MDERFPDYDPNDPHSEVYLPVTLVLKRYNAAQDELRRHRATLPRGRSGGEHS